MSVDTIALRRLYHYTSDCNYLQYSHHSAATERLFFLEATILPWNLTHINLDSSSSSSSSSALPAQQGKIKRIKLVVDQGNETSAPSGEEGGGGGEAQRSRATNSHINGSIYLAQNGTIVRTRRMPHPNNLKGGSPCRLSKHFKKLDKLGVTHEEPTPISIEGCAEEAELGSSPRLAADVILNARHPSSNSSGSLGPADVRGFGSKNSIAKVSMERINSGGGGVCANEERETCVDNHRDSRETLESHSEHTLSEEDELWMGPWNSLHIPMTKL